MKPTIDFSKLTGLARGIDPRLPSNRFMVLTSVGAGATAAVWNGLGDLVGAIGAGFVTGMAVFLAWAIARELDPDQTASAGVAMLVAWAALWFGRPGLGATAAILVAVRITIRSTGVAHRVLDRLALVAFAAYLGTVEEAWAALATLVIAVALDGTVLSDRAAGGVALAAAMVVVGAVAVAVAGTDFGWRAPTVPEIAAVALAVVAGVWGLVLASHPTSVADYTGEQLEIDRLRAGRAVALLAAVLAAGFGGESITALTPLFAAMVAVSAVGTIVRLQGHAGSGLA